MTSSSPNQGSNFEMCFFCERKLINHIYHKKFICTSCPLIGYSKESKIPEGHATGWLALDFCRAGSCILEVLHYGKPDDREGGPQSCISAHLWNQGERICKTQILGSMELSGELTVPLTNATSLISPFTQGRFFKALNMM